MDGTKKQNKIDVAGLIDDLHRLCDLYGITVDELWDTYSKSKGYLKAILPDSKPEEIGEPINSTGYLD